MNQGGNYWTLFTPGIWKVLHAVFHGYITEGIAPLDGITDMHVLLHSLDVYCNKNPRAIIALGIEQFLLVRRKMLLNQGAPH